MDKEKFVARFAKECGVTLINAEAIIDSVFDVLGHLLYEEGEDVSVGKFGHFRQTIRKGRRVIRPDNGEEMTYPTKRCVRFCQPQSTIVDIEDEMPDGGNADGEAD